MAETKFYGDVELARIRPMVPRFLVWYIYQADNTITWHCRPVDSEGPVMHADSPDGLIARAHEFDLSEGR